MKASALLESDRELTQAGRTLESQSGRAACRPAFAPAIIERDCLRNDKAHNNLQAGEGCRRCSPESCSIDSLEEASELYTDLDYLEEASELSTDLGSDSDNDSDRVLLLFDWDDTIFPTSWLCAEKLLENGAAVSAEQRTELQRVSESAASLLRTATELGKVVIVTNAQQGWVEMSSEKYLPSLVPLLEDLDVVSARSNHEDETCSDPSEWKCKAFEMEIDLCCWSPGQRRDVISIGDSMHEHRALQRSTQHVPNCHGKTVKFLSKPSVKRLVQQHDVLRKRIRQVVLQDGSADLEIAAEM